MQNNPDNVRQKLETLQSAGRLEIPVSKQKQLLGLVGCIVFTALGALLLLRPSMLEGRELLAIIAGILGVGFFGVILIPTVIFQLIRGGQLVITPDGVHMERHSGGQRIATDISHWSDITAVFTERVGASESTSQEVVAYSLTPRGQQIYKDSHPQIAGWRDQLGAKMNVQRPDCVYLTSPLTGPRGDLLVILQQAHALYGGATAQDGQPGQYGQAPDTYSQAPGHYGTQADNGQPPVGY